MQKRFNWQVPVIAFLVLAVVYLFVQQLNINSRFAPKLFHHAPQLMAMDSTMGGGYHVFTNTWVVSPGIPQIPPNIDVVITNNSPFYPPAFGTATGSNVDGTTFQVTSALLQLNHLPNASIPIPVMMPWNPNQQSPADMNAPDFTVVAPYNLNPGDTIVSVIYDYIPGMGGMLGLRTGTTTP